MLDTSAGHVPTSLGVVVYENSTTLLVGTATGQLLKVSFSRLLTCLIYNHIIHEKRNSTGVGDTRGGQATYLYVHSQGGAFSVISF